MSREEPRKARRFSSYRDALKAVSIRTGTPLSSLAISFTVLHEFTAIVPLVGVFYGARALGVGERIVTAVVEGDPDSVLTRYGWVREKCKTWVDDGEHWAARVGKKYGVFGFEKGQSPSSGVNGKHHLVGDIANAVFAYGLTKALLPVRIGISLYLSPAFSRGIIEPIRTNIMRPFRRNPPQ